MKEYFFDRDLSWLSFNERVLMEAASDAVPLGERLKFLSIYSSNLDEFYRVRVPALMALSKLSKNTSSEHPDKHQHSLERIKETVNKQLAIFGNTLREKILAPLKEKNIHILYNEPIPEFIKESATEYFFNQVLGYLQPVDIEKDQTFFIENNKLYSLVILRNGIMEQKLRIINIPTEHLPRFLPVIYEGIQYIIFLEDIIKDNLNRIFKGYEIAGVYNFKITRDAELELQDEYETDLVEKMEKQIAKRDFGFATRFLYDAKISPVYLHTLIRAFNLENANIVEGGSYHNLKDLAGIPINEPSLFYEKTEPCVPLQIHKTRTLLEQVAEKDIMLHPPYHTYDPVLRFFNEAAIDPAVEEIHVTLYRVAQQSKIVNALISAAKNGKEVTVLVELKARFDESNNIRWAKRMKEAGIKIHYSPLSLKVHAKCALIKKREYGKMIYLGLLATGNLNEVTARFYTDHILLSSHPGILRELELLFLHLAKKRPTIEDADIRFQHLLVAQFNLKKKFIRLIDREISNAKLGRPAFITIKLNNLEEKSLIRKLYQASVEGVKIQLLIRSVCCLVPGVEGVSGNITVKRIVDRYLEHGRVFIFHNDGEEEIYLGSADWMTRNIDRRIEVCFPVYDPEIKKELRTIIDLQLQDNMQAVIVDKDLRNVRLDFDSNPVRSQAEIQKQLIKTVKL